MTPQSVKYALFGLGVTVAGIASADAITDIAGAVDLTSVATGLGTVAVAVAGLYVVIRGARILLGFVKR